MRPALPGSSFATPAHNGGDLLALRSKPSRAAFALPQSSDQLGKLRALISYAEAASAGGYDAVHSSAAIKPPKRPTLMTIAEIQRWVSATPGQQHAIGNYQIIPATLESLVARTGLPKDTLFSVTTQDALANVLIADAEYVQFLDGKISIAKFMDNLAQIWAGLPLGNGKSAYDGLAGNKATISRATFDLHMRSIFAAERHANNRP